MKERQCMVGADCPEPRPPHNRKYCARHSAQARILWKRNHRRQEAAAGRQPWLEHYLRKNGGDLEKARAEYNADRRKRRRDRHRLAQQRLLHLRLTGRGQSSVPEAMVL